MKLDKFQCQFNLRHSQKLWLVALDSWEYAPGVKKKSGRKIFFHHGEILFWKNISKKNDWTKKSQKNSMTKIFFKIEIQKKINIFRFWKIFSFIDFFWDFFVRSFFFQKYFFKIKFLHDEKIFFIRIFFNFKSILSAVQRNQPELLRVSEQETARQILVWLRSFPWYSLVWRCGRMCCKWCCDPRFWSDFGVAPNFNRL